MGLDCIVFIDFNKGTAILARSLVQYCVSYGTGESRSLISADKMLGSTLYIFNTKSKKIKPVLPPSRQGPTYFLFRACKCTSKKMQKLLVPLKFHCTVHRYMRPQGKNSPLVCSIFTLPVTIGNHVGLSYVHLYILVSLKYTRFLFAKSIFS